MEEIEKEGMREIEELCFKVYDKVFNEILCNLNIDNLDKDKIIKECAFIVIGIINAKESIIKEKLGVELTELEKYEFRKKLLNAGKGSHKKYLRKKEIEMNEVFI